jgi:tetratricopeptide (TPR) repeat protein
MNIGFGFVRRACLIACLVLVGCSDPQTRKAEHIGEGWKYFHAANYAKARVEFQNALQIDPDDSGARFGLGQTFEKLGDVRNAFGHYGAAAADPKHLESRIALARLLLFAGDIDGARKRVTEALALAPKDASALAVRAGVEAAAGDREAAEATAREALARNPSESGAVALLASLYMRSDRYEDAHALLRNAVAANPQDVGVRAVYARVLLEANQADAAIEQLEAISRTEPDNLSYLAQLLTVVASTGHVDAAQQRLDQFVGSHADNAAKLMKVDFLRRFRTPAAAVAALRQDVEAAPDDAELRLALAGLLADTGDVAGAEAQYRAVAQQSRVDKLVSDADVGLASLLMRNGRVPEAKATLADTLKREPTNGRALGLRGQIALSEGDATTAVGDLRAALRDDPNSIALQQLLASAYQASAQPLLAKETLMNALQLNPADESLRRQMFAVAASVHEWDLALTQANALESLGAPAAEVLDLRLRAAVGEGNFESALLVAKELTARSPAIGEFYTGAALQALQRPKEAEAHYLAALKAKPDAIEPLGAVVRLYLDSQRAKDAEALLTQTIARTPTDAQANNLLGQVLLADKRAKDAAAAFAHAIELRRDLALPYRGLASAQSALGDRGAAERTYRQGIAATHDAGLYVDLALFLDESHRYDDAVAAYEEGLQRNPGSPLLANNLAMTLVTRDATAAAVTRAEALVSTFANSEDAAYLDTVGWVHYKAGRLADAESQLARAVAKRPEAPLLRYHYAQVLADRGSVDQARSQLDEALKAKEFSERANALALKANLDRRAASEGRAGA